MGKRSEKNHRAARNAKLKEKSDAGSLTDAAVQLAARAKEESDPFMRKLLLFTAGGVAASAAMRDVSVAAPNLSSQCRRLKREFLAKQKHGK